MNGVYESCARRILRTECCARVTCAQNKKFIFYTSTVNNSTSRITCMYADGLPGLIFSRFIFPRELFIYCRFINRIKISAHLTLTLIRPHPHYCPHPHSHSRPHPQDRVGIISICIGIFL